MSHISFQASSVMFISGLFAGHKIVDIWLLLKNACTSLLLCTKALSCWKKMSFPTFNIIIDRTLSFKSLIYSVDWSFSSLMENDRGQLSSTMTPPPWHCLLHLTTCSWHNIYVLESSGPSSDDHNNQNSYLLRYPKLEFIRNVEIFFSR